MNYVASANIKGAESPSKKGTKNEKYKEFEESKKTILSVHLSNKFHSLTK